MARIVKYSTGIVGVIKHNIREFKNGKCPTNLEVDSARTPENYSIIRRGKTAREIEKYRKQIENECFHYNRKNIVHANEVVCTLPVDCPAEQEKTFFEETYKYICSTLPMGEKCVFLAEVHADEGKISKDGITIVEGQKHLHIMYVPAVSDAKHEGYQFKLCSDALTRRSILKAWHPAYQAWLDKAGIKATVASGVTSGKGVSVKAMKEISKEIGLSLDQIKTLQKNQEKLQSLLLSKENEIRKLQSSMVDKNKQIQLANDMLSKKQEELFMANEKIKNMEKDLVAAKPTKDLTWGDEPWGASPSAWTNAGATKDHNYEEEKTW